MPRLSPRSPCASTQGSAVARRLVHVGTVLAVALVASGCADAGVSAPDAVVSASPSAVATTVPVTPTPTPAPAADPTTFDADADVEQNLAVFRGVIEHVWAGADRGQGRAYIDALVAAGFAKSAMEITADTTTVGNAAESIQVAVLWKGQCLIGQVGTATGKPVAIVGPVLAERRCLVGDTRTIDW